MRSMNHEENECLHYIAYRDLTVFSYEDLGVDRLSEAYDETP